MKSLQFILRSLLLGISIYSVESSLTEDEQVNPCKIGEPLRCPDTGTLFNCNSCPEAYDCILNKYCCVKEQYSSVGVCKMGWDKFENNCYLYQNFAENWFNARDKCKELGSFLTDITNIDENRFISDIAKVVIWIGGKENQENNQWYWHNGNKITFSKWERGEPSNHTHEDCLEMLKNQDEWRIGSTSFRTKPGNWNDNNCVVRHSYMCKYSLDQITEDDQSTSQSDNEISIFSDDEQVKPCEIGEPLRCPESNKLFTCNQCPDGYRCTSNKYCCIKEQHSNVAVCKRGWNKFENNCYHYQSFPETWHNAKKRCQDLEGFLTDITNEEENKYVSDLAMGDIWIGGTDNREENQWYWHNGNKITFAMWEVGEPSSQRNENCLEMLINQYIWKFNRMTFRTTPGNWNNNKCFTRHPFVCKYSLGN